MARDSPNNPVLPGHIIMKYQIDQIEPSPQFLEARNLAGSNLEKKFSEGLGKYEPPMDYRWLKAEMTWPSHDHLTFGYGNQIFSVLVSIENGSQSSLTPRAIQTCKEVCKKNSLIPCCYTVNANPLRPKAPGWNLTHLETGEPVVPGEWVTRETIPLSEWELRNLVIQIVREQIANSGKGEVESFCDVSGIDPQIWFKDKEGEMCWVIVRHHPKINGDEKQAWIGCEESNPLLQKYDGYFAAVSIASSATVLRDLEGNVIPPSKRYNGEAPLYRCDGYCVRFEGLQRIYVC